MQRKVNQLTILARAILPSLDNLSNVRERLRKLLSTIDEEYEEEEEPLELPRSLLSRIDQGQPLMHALESVQISEATAFVRDGY